MDYVSFHASLNPDKPVVTDLAFDRRWRYEQFDRFVAGCTAILMDEGVVEGDRVACQWGEVGCLFYVPEAAEMHLEHVPFFLTTRLANYKVPKHAYATSELPRDGLGSSCATICEEFIANNSESDDAVVIQPEIELANASATYPDPSPMGFTDTKAIAMSKARDLSAVCARELVRCHGIC